MQTWACEGGPRKRAGGPDGHIERAGLVEDGGRGAGVRLGVGPGVPVFTVFLSKASSRWCQWGRKREKRGKGVGMAVIYTRIGCPPDSEQ